MPRSVIFDVDGTLVDTNELHVAAWQDAFKEFQIEVSNEAVRSQIGKGGDQLLPALLSAEKLTRDGEAIEKRRGEIFKRDYLGRSRAFPCVRELLQRIRGAGLSIALASSGKRDEVQHHCAVANIEDLIDGFTSADDAEHSKPAPDIFAAALKKLPAGTSHATVVVGDTPYDAQAARTLGLPVVGLLCGGFSRAELEAAGCVAIYQDAEHLLRDYESSPLRPSA